MSKSLVNAVRIYEKGETVFADIKTSPRDGSKVETIIWTKEEDRNRFIFNGYTLFYDERTKKAKPF